MKEVVIWLWFWQIQFLLLTMGMNNATSTYSCLWCTVRSSERWDMSVEESVYTEKKTRSLSHFANKPCQKHLGSIHPPLLNIELTMVVVEWLHLLLWVTDVLIRNLISLAASRDHEEQQRWGECSNHIRQLEQAVQSCKVTFTIWQHVDGDGRPQPGKYDCTSLNGTERLRVLCTLPAKFDTSCWATVCLSQAGSSSLTTPSSPVTWLYPWHNFGM